MPTWYRENRIMLVKQFRVLVPTKILLVFCCSCLVTFGYGRHIIGSDFYFNCKGTGRVSNTKTYELNLTIYRDCSNPAGSGYDPDATFGIYRFDGNRYIYVQQLIVNHGSISRIKPDNNPCLIIPPNVCVEQSSYNFTVDLPVINETYVIYYMRCCRNNTILNIVAPNNTGATFFIEISPESQRTCNTSPRFKSFPPIVICADFPFDFDHSAVDNEGDSLVYEFCTPYAGGGSGANDPTGGGLGCTAVRPNPLVCAPPFEFVNFVSPLYSTNSPMGPDVMNLDPVTGRLVGKPKELGQFVVGICVKEYRNGVLIGSIHRDFQFNIGICEQSVFAKIKADTSIGKEFTVNYCGDRNVKLFNESYREEYIKNYYWEFTSKTSSTAVLTSLDRNPTILFPEPGEYRGIMIVNKNAVVCSDTAFVNLKIIPSDLSPSFDFTYDKCSSLPIQFKDKSTGIQTPIKTWSWDFKDGDPLITSRNPNHLFKKPGNYDVTLTVSDGKICKASATKPLAYFPAPELIDILPDKFRACVPAKVHFDNFSLPLDSNYLVQWDFGDGQKATGLNADHTYTSPGDYTISLSIKAPSGCVTTESFPSFVKAQEGPEASFDFSPKEITTLNAAVKFDNSSRDAIRYSWNFGDEQGSEAINPIHIYRDTGSFVATLIAIHQNGCIDTAQQKLDILLNISYFLPNAFSPNNDGVNDIYKGTGALNGMQDFVMLVFNRWGEIVFTTDDPLEGWNGRKKNQGNVEPNGVYVCVVRYKTDRGESRELKSFATLIR